MRWSMGWAWWIVVGLGACTGAEPVVDEGVVEPVAPPLVEATEADRSAVAALHQAVDRYRDEPSSDGLAELKALVDRGMARPEPRPAAVDLALADALANGLLRPDLGKPLFERHVERLDARARDARLDMWLRADLVQLRTLAVDLHGDPIDTDHPTARTLALRAQSDPTVTWRDLRDGVTAATMVEQVVRRPAFTVQEEVASVGAALEVVGILLEGWVVEVASARATVPADADPLLTPGVVPADGDRRRIVGYASGTELTDLRRVGTALDLLKPRGAVVVMQIRPPGGGRMIVSMEGRYIDGTFVAHGANDAPRIVALAEATHELLTLRAQGLEPAAIHRSLGESYRQRFLTGRSP